VVLAPAIAVGTALVRTLLVGWCALLSVSPWLVRNRALTGNWTTIFRNRRPQLLIGNHPGALGGYAYRKEINEHLARGLRIQFRPGYRLGRRAIAAAPLRAGLRVVQKVSYFFALETDGVLWNLKGLAAPPSTAVTLVLLGVANAAYLCMLSFAVLADRHAAATSVAALFLLLTGYLVLVAAVFVGDPGTTLDWCPGHDLLSEGVPGGLASAVACGTSARCERAAAVAGIGAIVVVLLVLMTVNLALKAFEFRVLGTGSL